jgi:peptidoglycan/xylan/chitin deacetylase (PgdA/CDA1 family)
LNNQQQYQRIKKQIVLQGRRLLLSASARVGTPRLFRKRSEASVTALLFHRFFAKGESRQCAIDRLRRELDWLRATHTPISLSQFVDGRARGTVPDHSVLVTIDDALVDILDIANEFKAFEVPFAVFVCAGWAAAASSGKEEDLVARTASAIQWYQGANIEICYGRGRRIKLSPDSKASNIDALIVERDALRPDLEELCIRIQDLDVSKSERNCCTWEELRHLAMEGVDIGAHSITHVPLSQVSAVRRRFEIAESKRLCEALVGHCEAFAYPYGMANTHNGDTKFELQLAGFSVAFLTHSGFITVNNDALTLPRISMPDEPMTDSEFRARACGGGIVLRSLKDRFRAVVRD